MRSPCFFFFFVFQAEDGIRDLYVTGVQTCALPILLVMMDQNGRGKGDQITRRPRPINTTTGTASWNHGALEPCYSWNNIYTPNGHVMGYGVRRGQPTTKANVDYYNLGAGFPVNSTPAQVSSIYTAALNGVDYTGTFVYPHPLVSGSPTPTPSATPRSQQHLQKKEAKKAKKAKKKKRRPKKSGNDMAERLARGSHLVNARRCSHGAVRCSGHPTANDAIGAREAWLQHFSERFYSVAPE